MTSKRCGMSAVDRISELPEAIITEILNLLPTKNAVATSILSKSWRVRWKEVTTFDMEVAWYHRNTCGMKQFVDNFASIRSFRLWWDASYSQEHLIRSAISAIPRAVKVLDLVNNSDTHAMYELPAEIFSSEDLEFMRLDGQFEIKLPDVVCLPKLAELELINWVCKQTSTETISELISNCPVLQSLTIRLKQFEDKILAISSFSLKRLHISCYDLCNEKEYRIDASALEYLFLYSSSKDISIHDSTLSSVNEVDLDVTYDSIVGLLESFHGVKSMKISCSVMCFLTIDIKKLSKSFERLTKLVVDCFFEHHVVVDLIDRCVNLKLLQINFGEVNSASSSLWCSSAVIPGCLSSSLQTLGVKFKLCPDCEVDLTVIEFILNHSSVLERVNLSFESRFEEKDDFLAFQKVDEILEKVLMMPKASPTCKLALTLW